MQQESPPKRAFSPGSPDTRTTPVQPSRDPQDRGFPEEHSGPPLDDRGFPLEEALGASPRQQRAGSAGQPVAHEAEVDDTARTSPLPLHDRGLPFEEALGASPRQRRGGAAGRPMAHEAEVDDTARATPPRSLRSSPMRSVSAAEEKTAETTPPATQSREGFMRSWATASRRIEGGVASISPTTEVGSVRGEGRGQDEPGGGSQRWGFSPSVRPNPQNKGSHAKLDLLLQEVQRLNGRLDTIVNRLGDLEEERDGAATEDKSPR